MTTTAHVQPPAPPPSMSSRELPEEEFARLQGLGFFADYPIPPGYRMRVWVVEYEGAIVGYWCLLAVYHTEPIWIAPTTRNTQVLRELMGGMVALLRAEQCSGALAIIDSPELEQMAQAFGYQPVPGTIYKLEIPPADPPVA